MRPTSFKSKTVGDPFQERKKDTKKKATKIKYLTLAERFFSKLFLRISGLYLKNKIKHSSFENDD